jgi:glycopeptide antibiotics resistance protein
MKIFLKIIVGITLLVYLFVLSKLILFKGMPLSEMMSYVGLDDIEERLQASNFYPFKTILYYAFFADVNLQIRVSNLVGNIILFIPFGFLLPLLAKKLFSLKAVIPLAFLLSLTIETVQILTTIGRFDIDDLILNTIGAVIGYYIVRMIYHFFLINKKGSINEIHTQS